MSLVHVTKDETHTGDCWRARVETFNDIDVLTVYVRENATVKVRDHGHFAVIGLGDHAGIYLKPAHLAALREHFAKLEAKP